MVTTPSVMPVAVPVEDPIVATALLLLLHTPPLVASVNVVVKPTHTLVVPPMAEGFGLTVKLVTAIQLVLIVYVIVTMPSVMPVTVPVDEPIVATPGLLLLQTPPEVASVNVVVIPTHTLVVPPIAAGFGLTVTVVVTKDPPIKV